MGSIEDPAKLLYHKMKTQIHKKYEYKYTFGRKKWVQLYVLQNQIDIHKHIVIDSNTKN